MWICAGDGLARFDGYSFVNYDQTKGLPKTAIITYINGYTNSKAEFIETFKSGARKILSLKGERKIRVYGDLAFVIGDMTDVSKMGGRDSQLYYRWSLVLAKRQDRRQVVSYHCTTIASPRKQIEAEITKATDEAMDALAHNGFILVMFGFLLQWPTLLTLAMFPVLTWMYVRLARAEEREAITAFGDAYRSYASAVPAFVPHLRSLLSSPGERPTP